MAEHIPRIAVPTASDPAVSTAPALIDVKNLSLFYGRSQALKDISFGIGQNVVTAFIGPSGCGKSTLLRCFNRMNDLIDNASIRGSVGTAPQNIYGPNIDVIEFRKQVGRVFRSPIHFPNRSTKMSLTVCGCRA